MAKRPAGKYRLKPGHDHYVSGGEGNAVARKIAGDIVELTEDQANTPAFIRKFDQVTPAGKSESVDLTGEGKPPLREDGPTLEEYVAAGYKAENYPPPGYAVVPSDGYVAYLKQLEAATSPKE